MAITSAVCNSFKAEVLQAIHNFTASSGNAFKLALYTSSATLNKSTTSSVGSLEAFNEEGWGRQEWGNSGWGVEYAVQLTGQQVTSSTGSITTEIAVPLTGLLTTSALGSLTLDIETFVNLTGLQLQLIQQVN